MLKAYIPCRLDTSSKAFAASCISPLAFSATYLRFVTKLCILPVYPKFVKSIWAFWLTVTRHTSQICHKHMCITSTAFSRRFEKTRVLLLPTQLVSAVFPFCFYISAGIVSICQRGRWGTRSGFWQANNKPKNWTFLIFAKQGGNSSKQVLNYVLSV